MEFILGRTMTNRIPGCSSEGSKNWALAGVALRQAALPMGLFDQEKSCSPRKSVFALHRAIFEISGDSAIELKLGTEVHIERYYPIAIAVLYARSFRDALPADGALQAVLPASVPRCKM
jgi:hypothetical protein